MQLVFSFEKRRLYCDLEESPSRSKLFFLMRTLILMAILQNPSWYFVFCAIVVNKDLKLLECYSCDSWAVDMIHRLCSYDSWAVFV